MSEYETLVQQEDRPIGYSTATVFRLRRAAFLVVVSLFVLAGLTGFWGVPPAHSGALQAAATPTAGVTPGAALAQLRATEDATLTSYGWVDRKNGVVHIPIDRAIDLLAQRGLPTRPEPETF